MGKSVTRFDVILSGHLKTNGIEYIKKIPQIGDLIADTHLLGSFTMYLESIKVYNEYFLLLIKGPKDRRKEGKNEFSSKLVLSFKFAALLNVTHKISYLFLATMVHTSFKL